MEGDICGGRGRERQGRIENREVGWGQIVTGPTHHVREHGLYPESTWKQLKGFSHLSDAIISEL